MINCIYTRKLRQNCEKSNLKFQVIVKKNLVLLGMMAVGKTTLGKMIAKKLGFEFIDTDNEIERKNRMNIKEIFEKKGEGFFRSEEEKEVLNSINKNNCTIAIGGGAFINKKIREEILKKTISFWLDLDIELIKKRIKNDTKRPLLFGKNIEKKIEEIYEKRKEIYELAQHKIVCNKLSKEDIIKSIIELYENKQNIS